MKILFAVSEVAPYSKSGGLGDVAGALPQALSEIKGNEVCVVSPYYSCVKNNPDINAEFIGSVYVPLSWRNAYAGVFKKVVKTKKSKVTYYFIDNEFYFNRNSLYGDTDDGERFAFFSKAALECIPLLDFEPDIIHANDWQTGFIPLFLKVHYQANGLLQKVRTVFTIHNIEYQGKALPDFLTEVLGVDECHRGVCTFDGMINAMKTAIVLCDKLTTVSETYSHEIRYAYFANGLDSIINDNSYKLSGVVNGIDTKLYNPLKDPFVPHPFKSADLSGKARCKSNLQEKLELEVNPDVPLVAMVTRLVRHKGLELVEEIMPELMHDNIQLVILGTGDSKYEDMFNFYAYSFPNKVSANITFSPALASEVYSAADFLLMPSKTEPCGLSQLIAMRYGTIPIVRETGGLVDTVPPLNPHTLEGRGITFKTFNAHDMLDAIRRALSFCDDKESLNLVRTKIMEYDSSWKAPAQKYMEIYTS